MSIDIVILSLPRLAERRAQLRAALGQLGLHYRLHDGMDRVSVDEADVRAKISNPAMSLGDACCTLSHLDIWRGLAEGTAAAALILEDDAQPARDLVDWADKALSVMGRLRLDVLKLEAWGGAGVNRTRPFGVRTEVRGAYRLAGRFVGSAAYVIRRDAAARLVSAAARPDRPVDHLLFAPGGPLRLRTGFVAPAPVLHDPTRYGSDIARTDGGTAPRGEVMVARLSGARRVSVGWSGCENGTLIGVPHSVMSVSR